MTLTPEEEDKLRQLEEEIARLKAKSKGDDTPVTPTPSTTSGDVVADKDITARDIITGVQVNYIVKQYYQGNGQAADRDYRLALSRYLRWLSAAMGQVVLSGIKRGGQQAIQLSLDEIYVPLAAESVPQSRTTLRRLLGGVLNEETEKTKAIDLTDLMTLHPRLVITGGPGCGKTTILQNLAWTLAQAIINDDPTLAKDRLGLTGDLPLPIYVPLSLYAAHRHQFKADPNPRRRQLATFVSYYLLERQAGLELPEDFFASLLNQGRYVLLLLDGLDEVPSELERGLVSQAVRDLTHGRDHARFVVSSRTQAYEGKALLGDAFRQVRVLPLTPEQVSDLIQRAYQAIFPDDVEKDIRERRANELIDGVKKLESQRAARLGNKEASRLVTSPLLVRMLLIVHFNLRRLPDQRAELYQAMVETLLTSAHNPDAEVAHRLAQLGGDTRIQREMFQYLAFTMHNRGAAEGREVEERPLETLLTLYLTERGHQGEIATSLVGDFIAMCRGRGGLLTELVGRYRFSHLGFQEFLAARYLAEVARDVTRIANFIGPKADAADSWWREPILLTLGHLNMTAPDTATNLIRTLAGLNPNDPPPTLNTLELAATAFLEWGGAETTHHQLQQTLIRLVTDPTLTDPTPLNRAKAGRVLAQLGDTRPGVGLNPTTNLPDLALHPVPGGPFLLGANPSEKDAWKDENPQHTLTLPTFYIARYPVTNAQYAPFIEAGGYDDPTWWPEAGWAWRQGDNTDVEVFMASLKRGDKKNFADYQAWVTRRTAAERHQPYDWQDEKFNQANQPVVGVTWYEAVAWCAWLNNQFQTGKLILRGHERTILPAEGWTIRLPGEAEWEKAAGWLGEKGHKQVYPWGDEWQPDYANTNQQIGATSAVGLFPLGAAPCGALDMIGNVAEWTLSVWGDNLYKPAFPYPFDDAAPQITPGGREALDTPGLRVLRGGSWWHGKRPWRVSARFHGRPDTFYDYGFRVLVSPVNPTGADSES